MSEQRRARSLALGMYSLIFVIGVALMPDTTSVFASSGPPGSNPGRRRRNRLGANNPPVIPSQTTRRGAIRRASLARNPASRRRKSTTRLQSGLPPAVGESAGFDGDLTRLGALDFGQLQPENSVAETRVDLRLVDRLRQRELAEEGTRSVLRQDG